MKPTVMLLAFALASLATAACASNDERHALDINRQCSRPRWGLASAAGRLQVHGTSMDVGVMKIHPLGIKSKPGDTAASVADHVHMDDVHLH